MKGTLEYISLNMQNDMSEQHGVSVKVVHLHSIKLVSPCDSDLSGVSLIIRYFNSLFSFSPFCFAYFSSV